MNYTISGKTGSHLESSYRSGSFVMSIFSTNANSKKVCNECYSSFGVYILTCGIVSDYDYLFSKLIRKQGKKHLSMMEHVCYECIEKRETVYVRSLKVKQLPLFINHVWVSEAAHEEFISRLKGVLV